MLPTRPENAEPTSNTRRPIRIIAIFVAASGVLTVPLVVFLGLPALFVIGVPIAVAAAIAVLWNTQWGLCFAAFAIMPLGAMTHEIFGLTLNLPEVVILGLAAKETFLFVMRKERFVSFMPTRTLALYLCAALVAIGTGLAYRNGLIKVLQDFRQFTEFIVLFWLVLQRVTTRQQIIQIMFCYVLGATLIAIHGIIQHYIPIGISKAQLENDLRLYGQVRSGSFYGSTPLGGLMVLAVGPAIGLALAVKRRNVKILMVVCICLCMVAAVYTNTRASWMAMAVLLAFIAMSIRPSAKTVAVAAAGAVVLAALFGPLVVQRISTLSDPADDLSLMERAQYYAAAVHIISAQPLLGLGWGCYYDIDQILINDGYVKSVRPSGASDSTVHSAYLQLLVKVGALGTLAFFSIIVVWIERVWGALRAGPSYNKDTVLFVCSTGAVVGYLFHSSFENFFQWPVMAQSFWLLLGLSFVTTNSDQSTTRNYRMPTAIVTLAGISFMLFTYACYKLEDSDAKYYEKNIAKATVLGDVQKALGIARRATAIRSPDPLAYALHGRLLLEVGETDKALEQLGRAVGLRPREEGPWREDTGRRYYFAPARLTLGKYYIEQDKLVDAVANFELARAYAVPEDTEYADFHAALYEAYSKAGLWARALKFGEPSDQELDGLDTPEIVELARVCEGEENWELAERLAQRLLTDVSLASEAHYLLGRIALARTQYESSLPHLEQAARSGHAQSAYFLGTALEKNGQPALAIEAFLRTPAGDVYRPFALARALTLIEGLPEDEQIPVTVSGQEILAALDREIAGMRLLPRPIVYDEDSRPTLIAVKTAETYFASGGRFPMLTLWEDGQAPASDPTSTPFSVSGTEDSVLSLRRGGRVLQLQWVENRVNWAIVERLQIGAGEVPGWVDTARDWFAIRPDHATRVEEDGTGNSFLSISGLNWIYSVPAGVRNEAGYLLAGRLRRSDDTAGLGWQSLDENERVLFEDAVLSQEISNTWTWQAGYIRPQPDREAIRVELNVVPRAGTVSFDDVLLVELNEPETTLAGDIAR